MSYDDVRRIAKLVKLHFEEDELELVSSNFEKALSFLSVIKTFDSKGLEPLFSPLEESPLLREDKSFSLEESETLLSLAPKSEMGFYQVPKVIE